MKTKIAKSIVFLFILLMIMIILSYIVVPKNNLEEFGISDVIANGILGEKDNSIDILVVGNSESFSSFVPMKFWEDFGFTSYVCGTPGQCLPDSMLFTYKTMENQSPKIVILEANNIYSLISVTDPFIKIVNYLLPVTEYHNRWKSLNKNDFFKKVDYTWTNESKGYRYSANSKAADISNYMTYSEEINPVKGQNKLCVKLLKKFCEMNDAELIIVSTPSAKNWNYENHNGIAQLAEEENIEFLDLNVRKEEIKINWEQDTEDEGDHLNYFGALKVTEYIGRYLSDKNILENHKEDDYYSNWEEEFKRYKSQINGGKA